MNSSSIENYLKAIFSLTEGSDQKEASTSAIADYLATKSSSVTDMLQKLNKKGLVNYQKYKGAKLTKKGRDISLNIVRKHRLWEVFLVDKLGFTWDKIHDIAEQMEHIQSLELTDRLDSFLDHPKFDPHGDPIPDKEGNIQPHASAKKLSDLKMGSVGVVVGVSDSSDEFLRYLEKHQINLGTELKVIERFDFDQSLNVATSATSSLSLSVQAARNILVEIKK